MTSTISCGWLWLAEHAADTFCQQHTARYTGRSLQRTAKKATAGSGTT
ncbi:hypothetical protein PSYJA_36294, partial [Pseudomonas syringae pv. japonica str. M301072]